MISAWQGGLILLLTYGLSLVFWLLDQILDRLNVAPEQRVTFLRSLLVLQGLVITLSFFFGFLGNLGLVHSLAPLPLLDSSSTFRSHLASQQEWSDWTPLTVGLIIYAIGVCLGQFLVTLAAWKLFRLHRDSQERLVQGHVVRASSRVLSPFSFAIVRGYIYVPDRFFTRSAEEQRAILDHENHHLLSRDPQWQMFSLLMRQFLFLSPFSWALHRSLELQTEIVCDAKTLQTSELSRTAYGNLLVAMTNGIGTQQTKAIYTYMGKSHLRRRILAMKAKSQSRNFIRTFLIIMAALVSSAAVAATIQGGVNPRSYYVRSKIFVNGMLISSPSISVAENSEAWVESRAESDPERFLRLALVANDVTNERVSDGIELKLQLTYSEGVHETQVRPLVLLKEKRTAMIETQTPEGDRIAIEVYVERR